MRSHFILVLNLGTSAQLCIAHSSHNRAPPPLLTEPFFGSQKVVVAASMNGGSAIDIIARVPLMLSV